MIVALHPKPRRGSREVKKTLERIVAADLDAYELANLNGAVLAQISKDAGHLLDIFIYPAKEVSAKKIADLYRRKMNDGAWLSEQLSVMYREKVNATRRPMLMAKPGILRRKKA